MKGNYPWSLHPAQQIQSAVCSINRIRPPALFRHLGETIWSKSQPGTFRGMFNLDIGGGKWNSAATYLQQFGIENVVFDPWNRSEAENRVAAQRAMDRSGLMTSVTVANVLNVIYEREVRLLVVQEASLAAYWAAQGAAWFWIYEGDRSGRGRITRKDAAGRPLVWQENRRTETYLHEIQTYFKYAVVKGQVIMAYNTP